MVRTPFSRVVSSSQGLKQPSDWSKLNSCIQTPCVCLSRNVNRQSSQCLVCQHPIIFQKKFLQYKLYKHVQTQIWRPQWPKVDDQRRFSNHRPVGSHPRRNRPDGLHLMDRVFFDGRLLVDDNLCKSSKNITCHLLSQCALHSWLPLYWT